MNNKMILNLVVVGSVAMTYVYVMAKVQRAANSPDFGRTVRMRGWRGVKILANAQEDWWRELGLKAGTQYNKCRL